MNEDEFLKLIDQLKKRHEMDNSKVASWKTQEED